MEYNCFIHNWFSDTNRCAVCEVLIARSSNKKPSIKTQPIEDEEFSQPNNFKKQMEDFFIPSIERMIVAEIEHLAYLKLKSSFFRDRKVKQFILKSEAHLKQFRLRLIQYQEYAKTL